MIQQFDDVFECQQIHKYVQRIVFDIDCFIISRLNFQNVHLIGIVRVVGNAKIMPHVAKVTSLLYVPFISYYGKIRFANGQLQINLRLYIQFTPWSHQLAPVNIAAEAFPTAA